MRLTAGLVAPGVVAVYWGVLAAASLTVDGRWVMHALWVYSLVGAGAIAYVGSPGRWAVRWIVLGALLPAVLPVVVLSLPSHDPVPDEPEMASFIALLWVAASVAQVIAAGLAGPVLRWAAIRIGVTVGSPDSPKSP